MSLYSGTNTISIADSPNKVKNIHNEFLITKLISLSNAIGMSVRAVSSLALLLPFSLLRSSSRLSSIAFLNMLFIGLIIKGGEATKKVPKQK